MSENFGDSLPMPDCTGCGITLQTKDPGQPGYIPEQALQRQPLVCQRCFRIKHYNEASGITADQNEFLRMLSHVADTQCLVVNIVDLFDFEGSMISGLHRFVGSNPVILVVNKIDLLPKVSNWNRIMNWVRRQVKEQGLRTAEIVLCSAKKNIGFDQVMDSIAAHRQGRDVYVVGATNVGKSTMINRMIREFSDLERELTTSQYPGTTLDLIKIPLDDGKHIVDTPGIVYMHRLTEIVPKKDLNKLIPDRTIRPVVYQLNDRQTLFFGACARFDFVRGERQSFTCYLSGSIPVHRTKLERADALFAEHRGAMLSPPSKEDLDSLPPWTKHSFSIPKGGDYDIYISGLGWIKANGKSGAEVVVHAPKNVKVVLRKALI